MIPSAANSDYPKFVADQVLTSDNLNDLFGYLDEQDRITRTNLLGIGIVCGLQVKTGTDTDGNFLMITNGTGVTSEGYLVTVKDIKYHYYNQFDAVKCKYYESFVNIDAKTQKMPLWELKQKGDSEDKENLFHKLDDPASFLSNKAVMLFVELLEANNKNCDPNSCDDKGTMVTVSFRPLLVLKSDAASLIAADNNTISSSSFNTLPDIIIPRWDVPSTTPVNAEDIAKAYAKVLSAGFISDIQTALSKSYELFQPIIKDEFHEDPFHNFDLVSKFAFLHDGTISNNQSLHIQYYYDLFSDLIAAYNEFCITGNEIISICCPDETLFPRHLLLGEALPLPYDTQSDYRHYFIYSPLFQHKDLLVSLKFLFRRMDLMLKNFLIPVPSVSGSPSDDQMIRITPSKLSDVALSAKAIPYYFTPKIAPAPLYQYWSVEKSQRNKAKQNLSYNSDQYAVDDFAKHPLNYDIEPYNFFRIEGIIGKDVAPVLETIKNRIADYRLPVKVVALATGSPGKGSDNDDCCFLSDLELQFRLLTQELLSCLEKNIAYWGSIEKRKDVKGRTRFEISEIQLTYNDNFIRYYGSAGTAAQDSQPAPKEAPKKVILEKAAQPGTETKTLLNKQRGEFIRGAFQEMTGETMASIYLEYQSLENINMGSMPRPKTKAEEENIPYYILIIIDEMEQLADLLGSENIGEFDATAFNDQLTKLFDACSKLGKLLSDYRATEYLIEKIRINAEGRDGDIDKIAAAMPLMSEDDASKIILLLLNLDGTNQFITQLQGSVGNYSAQQATIKSFFDRLDKDAIMIPIIKEPDVNFKSRYVSMLEQLKLCKCDDAMEKLKFLIERYREQLAKLKDINNFSVYVNKHPGLQHKAGVLSGGTFIIVYKGSNDPAENIADNRVLADFYLPYNCCNNCTPVEVTIQEAPPAVNTPPVARAGDNIFIQLPTNSATLDGSSSSDLEGPIKTFLWEQESGPEEGKIEDAGSDKTLVSNLSVGTYVFKLTVTDEQGATSSDTVTITVISQPNNPPKAIATADRVNITLPDNTVNLSGQNSTDPDQGAILTYAWSLSPGVTGASITTPDQVNTKATFASAGLFTFKLTVTDDKGATDTDSVSVLVNEKPNRPPVADAGIDQVVTLTPTDNFITLDGSQSNDPDNDPIKYEWALRNGPNTPSILNPDQPSTKVEGLVSGIYTFNLAVKDDKGATDSDVVVVEVKIEEVVQKTCGPLSKIILDFNNWNKLLKKNPSFKEVFKSYTEVLEFFKSLSGIMTEPVAKQLDFFASGFNGLSMQELLMKWLSELNSIIQERKDFRLLALMLYQVLILLSMYIVCIQDKDFNQAEVSVSGVFDLMQGHVSFWVNLIHQGVFTDQETAVVKSMGVDIDQERQRVVTNGESAKKSNYMNFLGLILSIIASI